MVVEDGWMINMDAAACNVTVICRLDRCPLEHIFVMPEKSRLLLLVSVRDDNSLSEGLDRAVNSVQNNGRITLFEREYFQLKCYVANTQQNALITGGVASNMYSLEKFVQDFKRGQGGFQRSLLTLP